MRASTIPAYVYGQYSDDDDLLAFNEAYNAATQSYVDFFNQVSLPVYTGPLIAGTLLDWVGQGLYGLSRPYIPLGAQRFIGPFNTYVLNGIPFNTQLAMGAVPYVLANDDLYKRILTWHHYRGDGRQFTIPWLKRRVARFLRGANGTDVTPMTTSEVSVSVLQGAYTILVSSGGMDQNAAILMQAAISAGLLELPFQYTFTVQLGS